MVDCGKSKMHTMNPKATTKIRQRDKMESLKILFLAGHGGTCNPSAREADTGGSQV
jgi:hypothetical protein